jgi:hypothetical protein
LYTTPQQKQYIIQKQQIVTQFDTNGNLINTFSSYLEASENTGIPKNKIMLCCNGVILSAENYVFRKDNEPFTYINKRHKNRIIQYDLNYNYVNIFLNCNEANKQTGIGLTAILDCCSNKRESIKGYIFKRIPVEEVNEVVTMHNIIAEINQEEAS